MFWNSMQFLNIVLSVKYYDKAKRLKKDYYKKIGW